MFGFGKTSLNKFGEYLNQKKYSGDSIKVISKVIVYLENRNLKPIRTSQLLEFMSDLKNFKLLINKYKSVDGIKEKKLLLKTLKYWDESLALNKKSKEEIVQLIKGLIRSKKLFDLELGFRILIFDELEDQFFNREIWNILIHNLQENNLEIAIETVNFLINVIQDKKHKLIEKFKENQILFEEFVNNIHKIILKKDSVYLIKIYDVLVNLLIDREFFDLMTWYIAQPKYFSFHIEVQEKLKMFNLLNYFDLIKLFIANPKKPEEIKEIIIKENENIMNFLRLLILRIDNINDPEVKLAYNDDFAVILEIVTDLKSGKHGIMHRKKV